ncbi:MAG: hypothetical protein JWR27_151 [Aeromicrobium sp.]|nr:hypothetical protein [Aeromicrobium sp.]
MNKTRILLALPAAALAAAAGYSPSVAATTSSNQGQYTPYAVGQPSAVKTAAIPTGYTPVYLETMGRHGSRAATSSSDIDSAIALINKARSAKALTSTGTRLSTDLATLKRVQAKVGNGKLSALGAQEWKGIGTRTVEKYPTFFRSAVKSQAAVDVVTSSLSRAQVSSANMVTGLKSAAGNVRVTSRQTNDSMLHFSTSSTAKGDAEASRIRSSSQTRAAAAALLKSVFSSSYVDKMSTSTTVANAYDLWEAVAIGPALRLDGAPVMSYLPAAALNQMAFLKDATAFYRYGPGVSSAGNASFKKAVVIRDNFFYVIDKRLFEGGKSVATIRLSHGEQLMPFAALLRLNPQATTAAPFTYASTGWNGNDEAKMAANIEWLVVAKGKPTKSARSVLVTMRYNEMPRRFSAACSAYEVAPYFYDLAGLKKCVGRS